MPPKAPKAIPHSTSICQSFSLPPCFYESRPAVGVRGNLPLPFMEKSSVSSLLIACQVFKEVLLEAGILKKNTADF